jgi:hypothetical protein
VTLRSSRLQPASGIGARVGPLARPRLERNVFVQAAPARSVALEVAADATPELRDNLFVGYSEVMKGNAARRQQLLQGNLLVPAAGAPATRSNR